MPETTLSSYLMEDQREAQRLADKVNPTEWVRQYFEPSVQGKGNVLDVGCGPGVLVHALAESFPHLEVCGLDKSPERLNEARIRSDQLPNVRWCQSNVSEMALPDNAFDFVFSRFLFEYLPNRQQALQEMIRVCRTGGMIMLQDLDGQLVWHDPPDEELNNILAEVLHHLRQTGFDPYIGRKLYGLVYAAGLTDITVKVDNYHLIPGRIDKEAYRLWELKLDIAMPVVMQAVGSEAAAHRVKKRFLDYLLRDDTLTYSVMFTVTGRKPS